jgi:non-reducing end alpha-L-arabinofuranosidase
VVGLCMRIKGEIVQSETPVESWTCDGHASQQWRFTGGLVVNPASGLCLTSPNDSTVQGTELVVSICGSRAGQRWTPPPLA